MASQLAAPRPLISVIVCTHNPRESYLRRALDALSLQTLAKDRWELLVVDNASKERLADVFDLSWHPHARHVREDALGLIRARLRGIAEVSGDLTVFVDDDNVVAADYLEQALAIRSRFRQLGAFGAGRLEPEWEMAVPPPIRSYVHLLAVRSVERPRWSNHPGDHRTIPWGAGLCVRRSVAQLDARLIDRLDITSVLGALGTDRLFGDDDLFSWAAA